MVKSFSLIETFMCVCLRGFACGYSTSFRNGKKKMQFVDQNINTNIKSPLLQMI